MGRGLRLWIVCLATVVVVPNHANMQGFDHIDDHHEVTNEPVNDMPSDAAICQGASYGGSVVSVGGYCIELFPRPSGLVEATARTGKGVIINPLSMEVAINMGTMHHGVVHVAMHWDPMERVFRGYAPVGVTFRAGPVEVFVHAFGKTSYQRSDNIALMPFPSRGGFMISVGRYVFEIVPRVSGAIEVYPRDPLTTSRADLLALEVSIPTVPVQKNNSVRLHWDPDRNAFTATLLAPVRIVAGPLRMSINDQRVVYTGNIAHIVPIYFRRIYETVVATNSYTVEMAYHKPGQLEAFVLDAKGAAPSHKHIQLIVNAIDRRGAVFPLAMVWDETQAHYSGRIDIPTNSIQTFYVKIRAGDASTKEPYEPMLRLIGYVDAAAIKTEPQ